MDLTPNRSTQFSYEKIDLSMLFNKVKCCMLFHVYFIWWASGLHVVHVSIWENCPVSNITTSHDSVLFKFGMFEKECVHHDWSDLVHYNSVARVFAPSSMRGLHLRANKSW